MTDIVRIVEQPSTVVVEEGLVRVVSVGLQGPPGGSGPLRTKTVPWASSLTLDWSDADVIQVTLAGPTVATFTGAQDGQRLLLEVIQGGAGSRTVTWPAALRYSSTIPGIVLSTAGGKLDRIGCIYRSGSSTYDLIALAIGF